MLDLVIVPFVAHAYPAATKSPFAVLDRIEFEVRSDRVKKNSIVLIDSAVLILNPAPSAVVSPFNFWRDKIG